MRIGIFTVDGLDIGSEEGRFVQVDAEDLSSATKRAAAARDANLGADVLVNIDVMIADEAASARAELATAAGESRHDTMLYVGTPRGLAGLIADIHALGIADGAVLHPLSRGTEALVYEQTVPVLRRRGLLCGSVRDAS